MKMKKAAALAMAFVCAAAVLFGGAVARADSLDLTRKINLTVNPGPGSLTDLANADVTVDLYRIAGTADDSGHGSTYKFKDVLVEFPKDVDITSYDGLRELDNSKWLSLAQTAAEQVLSDGSTLKPAASLSKGADGAAMTAELESGLYLVIAHQTDVSPAEYVRTGDDGITTTAWTSEYLYSWAPELVALPTTATEMGANGEHSEVSTAGGDWQYGEKTPINATLKPSQELRFGSLDIVKNVTAFRAGTSATFVFSVQAAMPGAADGEFVYDDVVSLTFDAAGTKTYTIAERIPVGAEVTVTEIYSGSGYDPVGAQTASATIGSPDTAAVSVSFTNTMDDTPRRGHGILNVFSYDGEKWNWDQQ